MTVILVGRSKIEFQGEYLKRIECECDLLHGMSSNYPQTALWFKHLLSQGMADNTGLSQWAFAKTPGPLSVVFTH